MPASLVCENGITRTSCFGSGTGVLHCTSCPVQYQCVPEIAAMSFPVRELVGSPRGYMLW